MRERHSQSRARLTLSVLLQQDVLSFAVFDMEGIGEPVPMGGFELHIESLLDQGNKWYTRKLRLDTNPEADCGQLCTAVQSVRIG